jgi:uncharacterized phage-associated protein
VPDLAKLQELVLFIAEQTKDDPDFGRTKLAKVLYYSDFEAYRQHGESLTGATYERREHGPFPRQLRTAEEALQRAGRAYLTTGQDEFDPKRILPCPGARADLSAFDKAPLARVAHWIGRIQPLTARQASDWSHEEPGWQLAAVDRAEIPLHTARISRRAPTKHDFRRGRDLARDHGWP